MTDTIDLSAERAAFEAFVEEWTGRDMDSHRRSETTGLVFAWECWQRATKEERKQRKRKAKN